MKTVFIFINGINSNPSDQRGWTDEFATEVNRRTPENVKTEKFEYHTTALLRRLHQSKRAEELARRVNGYTNSGWRVVLVGHSNGCDLIARALDLGVHVFSAHLFAPAADEQDFEVPILGGQVERIHIYGSPDDKALQGASLTRKLLRWVGLGYGSLGLRGPAFAAAYPHEVTDHSIPGYGHSTWFLPGKHLNATINLLLANHAADQRGWDHDQIP